MSWSIRHAGSPQSVSNLTLSQISQALADGEWETDDEVMGPGENRWTTIADHPELEDLAEALDTAAENEDKISHDPEEDRIDMNPLIDVCLVLLVFFILATTMAVMEKVLNLPEARQSAEGVVQKSDTEVKNLMLVVEARLKDGRTVIKLENTEVNPEGLMVRLRNAASQAHKSQVVIDSSKDVDWQTIVTIIDACSGAGITKVNFKVDPQAKPGAGPRGSAPAPSK